MADTPIGVRNFLDGTRRTVWLDRHGRQFVRGDDGERVYGLYLIEPDDEQDAPVVARRLD